MSFNLRCPTVIDLGNHWGFRKHLVVQTVRKFDPDILATQECVFAQAEYLQGQLPDYQFFGAGRNDGQTSGEMCGVFFKETKYRQLDGGHFWLSETPERPGSKSWGSTFTRMVTWVKLCPVAEPRAPFFVFNTHFDVWGTRARHESARLLRSRMRSIAGDTPVIITGDFNDDPASPTYRTLMAGTTAVDQKLVDTFRVAHPAKSAEDGTRHGFSGARGGERIDWIFTTPNMQTVAAGIDHTSEGSRFPSDHFPALAVIRPPAVPAMPPLAAARARGQSPTARVE
jgi:endonuclease/exonuclease/phosphatase family metal-dependent hydrolase